MNQLIDQITPKKIKITENSVTNTALKNSLFQPLQTIGSSIPLYGPTGNPPCSPIFKIDKKDLDEKGVLILNNTQFYDRLSHRDFGKILKVMGKAPKLLNAKSQLTFKEQQEKIHLLSFLCWLNFEFRTTAFLERTLGLMEKKVKELDPWGEHDFFAI